MKEKYIAFFNNIGILTLSGFASKMLSFFLVPLYTSVLSTLEFGNYDIVVSTLTILLPIVTLNISDAVMRFCMEKEREPDKAAYVGLIFTLSGIVISAFLLVIIGFTPLKKYIDGLWLIILFYFVAIAFNSYLSQLAKGREKVIDMGIAGLIGTAVALTANILFLLVLKMGLKGFFYAGILGSAIPDIYYFFRLRVWQYCKNTGIKKEYIKEMINYSAPLALVVIGWSVNSNFDKYMVTAFCGLATNGLLAVAYKIPNILSAFQGIFSQAWQISAIAEFKSKDSNEYYKSVFGYCMSGSALFCAVLIILTRPIAHILYAKEFYTAWQYVPFLLISFFLNFGSGLIGPILSAKMDSKTMARSALGGIIVNIFLNYILLKTIGIQGVTIATAVSSFCMYIIRKISIRNVINTKDSVAFYLSLLLLSGLAITEILLQNYIIEIVLLLLMLACNYKQISGMISKSKSLFKEKNDENSCACSD